MARLKTGIGNDDPVSSLASGVIRNYIQTVCAHEYLTELVTATSELPSRSGLRSASRKQYEMQRTTMKFGERTFSFTGQAD